MKTIAAASLVYVCLPKTRNLLTKRVASWEIRSCQNKQFQVTRIGRMNSNLLTRIFAISRFYYQTVRWKAAQRIWTLNTGISMQKLSAPLTGICLRSDCKSTLNHTQVKQRQSFSGPIATASLVYVCLPKARNLCTLNPSEMNEIQVCLTGGGGFRKNTLGFKYGRRCLYFAINTMQAFTFHQTISWSLRFFHRDTTEKESQAVSTPNQTVNQSDGYEDLSDFLGHQRAPVAAHTDAVQQNNGYEDVNDLFVTKTIYHQMASSQDDVAQPVGHSYENIDIHKPPIWAPGMLKFLM